MGHHLASSITSIFSILISIRIRSTKMKCFIALALLAVAALSYAEEAAYDIVETREKCHPVGPKPLCKKEMTKRERCHPVGPKPLCKKVEDEEHEVVVTKETCRVGTGSTGPICKKEVLKREKCHPTGMKPLCRRVVETEYEEVVTREMCPPLLSGGSGCKRISQEKRGCKPGPGNHTARENDEINFIKLKPERFCGTSATHHRKDWEIKIKTECLLLIAI